MDAKIAPQGVTIASEFTFIERDGDVYVPLYEKFEAELQALKTKEDTRSRARRRLMTYSDAGALKAIC